MQSRQSTVARSLSSRGSNSGMHEDTTDGVCASNSLGVQVHTVMGCAVERQTDMTFDATA